MSTDVRWRVHLLVNDSSGTGHSKGRVTRLLRFLEGSFEDVSASVVSDHLSAVEQTRLLMTESCAPTTVFVGGGGGTLRAVIEGIAAATNGGPLPGPERLRIATLRMGSGNLLAKELGVPRDPLTACERLMAGWRAGRTSSCCIGRYDFAREGGAVETRYAMSLAGFGALGRVPGDLERWHARFPRVRRALGAVFGLERWNDVEYAAATFLRAMGAALVPGSVEQVKVGTNRATRTMRLLAGVVMSFPIEALPFDAGTSVDEKKLTLHFVPYRGRFQAASLVLAPRRHARSAIRFDIEPSRSISIRLQDRDRVEMFLDEDPIELYRKVTISIPGSLAFVSAR